MDNMDKILTNEAYISFSNWLIHSDCATRCWGGLGNGNDNGGIGFEFLPEEFQVEMLIMWFDAMEIFIGSEICFDSGSQYVRGFDASVWSSTIILVESISGYNNLDVYQSRLESKKDAIVYANNYYNTIKSKR